MMTSMIEGGIRIPSVPEAAMVPVASFGLYPACSMVGRARSVIMTTDAPMMPVAAAKIVPIKVTASAKPPRTRRSTMPSVLRRSSATPDCSSMVPMKMNMGTATSTGFSAAAPQIRTGMLKNSM